ncbi:MAG: DUF6732 family protein [Pseudomonadota bacterium]
MKILVLTIAFAISLVSAAHAHWGHLGDIAGHSHWIGVGAVVVAGALAGVIGLLKDKEDDEEADHPEEVSDGEAA